MHTHTLDLLYPVDTNKPLLVFGKYPEAQFQDAVQQYPFLAAPYEPGTIGSETTRFIPIQGQTQYLVPQSVFNDHALHNYRRQTYPSSNPDAFIPYQPGQHTQVIQEKKEQLLLVLQPYDQVDPAQYYNCPQTQYDANDKRQLDKFTAQIPRRQSVHHTQLEDVCKSVDYHCIIKTPSSASGDGTWIIEDKDDFDMKKSQRENQDQLIVEEYLDIQHNRNINCHVDKDGKLTMLGYSQQIMENGKEYGGNIIPKQGQLRTDLPSQVQTILLDMANYLHTVSYVGVFLPDIVQSSKGNRYLIDPNIRLGGSTTAQCLRPQIFEENPHSQYIQNTSFHIHAQTSQQVIDIMRAHNIYLITCVQSSHPNSYKGYAMIHGKTKNEIKQILKTLPHYST